jgi:hypothetical protein
MKKLLALLFLMYLTTLAFSQKKAEMISTFLKIGADGEQIFCGYTPVNFYFSNKRVSIDSPHGSIDLEVIVRSREVWLGQDVYSNEFEITTFALDTTFGILIVPRDKTKHLLAFANNKNKRLCE